MKDESDEIESLILGGIIGAGLGALISKDKESGSLLGALAGAVLFGSLKAHEKAQKSGVPVYIKEQNAIYKILPNGKKVWVKNLDSLDIEVPKRFKLK